MEQEPTPIPAAVLDLLLLHEPDWMARLDRAVDYYMGNALAKSTKQVYKSAKKRYMLLCMSQYVPLLPASEKVLVNMLRT